MIVTPDSRPARGIRGTGSLFPLVFIVFLLVAPRVPPRPATPGTTLTVAGSTSVQPFAEKLAETYMAAHPGLAINVQGGGSTAGVRAAETGAAQIGMSSRHLKDSEQALHQVTIALDGIAIIVNAANPVAGLTRAQVAAIFAGEITRWSAGRRARPPDPLRHPRGGLGHPRRLRGDGDGEEGDRARAPSSRTPTARCARSSRATRTRSATSRSAWSTGGCAPWRWTGCCRPTTRSSPSATRSSGPSSS